MGLFQLGILAFLCLGICHCTPMFPKGYQWEYSYYASGNIGSQTPAFSSTGMKFKGKLIVESFSTKVVLMKFKDMHSMYHNGGAQYMKGATEPLPEEAKVIEKPFMIHYSGSKIDNIFVTPGEPNWAINMKKAVAGVFQLEMDKIDEEAFYTKESNIYGNCEGIEYNVQNVTDKHVIEIEKLIKFNKCHGSSKKMFTTSTPFTCKPQPPTLASARRFYTMKMMEDLLVVKNVTTKSERFVEGFYNSEGAYKMTSMQVINLIHSSKLPVDHIPDENDCTVKKGLVYEQPPHFDITHGRQPLTQEHIIELVKKLATKVVNRFDDKFVLDPSVLHQNSMQYMHWLMHSLTEEGFEKLYEEVSSAESCMDDMRRNIMLELLPQIGTHESLMFMKKKIVEGKFSEYLTLKMMAQFPFYVKELSEKLLVEMEAWLHLYPKAQEAYSDDIMLNTAVLSYSNLIFRTYSAGLIDLQTFEKYVSKFYDSYKHSESYGKKLLYMQAMRNLKHGSVFEKFVKMIKDKTLPHHFRFQAVWGIGDEAPKHPEEMFKLFSPIFKNRTEHTEMRVAAISMLLMSDPTPARFFSIYWHMKSEHSVQLYNMYYTFLERMQISTYPCFESLQPLADKFMRYVKKPPKTKFEKFTEIIVEDFVNHDSGLTSLVQMMSFGDDYADSANTVFFRSTKAGFGKILERYGMFLKVHGLTDFMDTHEPEEDDVHTVADINEVLKKANLKIRPEEELHVEIFFEVHNKIVFSKFYDLRSIMEQMPEVQKHFEEKRSKCGNSFNYQFVVPPMMTDYFDTTDFGTVAHIGFVKNSILFVRSNNSDATKALFSLEVYGDLQYGEMEFFEQRMDYFNPISNVHQGIVKMKAAQFGFGANISAHYHGLTDKKQIVWHDSNTNNGIVVHRQTLSYTANTDDILHEKKSPVFSVKHVNVGMGKKAKTVDKEFEVPLKHFGVKLVINLFDFDQSQNYFDFMTQIKDYIFNIMDDDLDFDNMDSKTFEYISKAEDFINYNIPEGKMGVAIRIMPLLKEPTVLSLDIGGDWKEMKQIVTEGSDRHNNSKADLVLGGSLQSAEHPDKIYYWWNTSMAMEVDFGMVKKFDWNFMQQEWKTEKPVSYCMHYNVDYDSGHCKHPRADFYNLEPISPMKTTMQFVWGKPKEDSCPDTHSIDFIYKGMITDDQIEASKEAKVWPFNVCQKELKGKPFNSVSEACYQAAVEMSTYRKYDTYISMKNAPKWMQKGYDLYTLASAFIPDVPALDSEFDEHGNIKFKFTEVFPLDEDEEYVQFIHGNETDQIETSFTHLFDLTNPKLERASEFEFEDYDTCVMTPDMIRSYDNETVVDYESKKWYIALTECTLQPTYVILMRKEGDALKYMIKSTKGDMEIHWDGDKIEVEYSKEKLDTSKSIITEHYSFDKHHNGYHMHLVDYKIDMTFRPGFTVMSSPEDDTCGLCNIKYLEYDDYEVHE